MLRRLLTDITPPVLLRLRRGPAVRLRSASEAASVNWRAYHDARIVDIVSRKTAVYRRELDTGNPRLVGNRQMTQDMFVLARVHPNKPLSVMELGGACGATYFEQDRLQPGRIRSWYVVETPPMAAAGSQQFADGRLAFFTDRHDAVARIAERDLLIVKGVLQYLQDPLGTLEDLLRFGFDYFYVSRTEVGVDVDRPLILERTAALSEHGPGPAPRGFRDGMCTVPAMIVPNGAVLARIAPGYRVAYLFDEDGGDRVRAGRRGVTTRMLGFLAERTS